MAEARIEDRQSEQRQPISLRQAVETLRARLSSVHVETVTADGDTALNVRFLGDGTNLEERRLLVKNLAYYLPSALSIIGVKPEPEQSSANDS